MANYNKILLMGNLTRDPQLSYLPSQTAVTEFGLAVNRVWTGKDGTKKEDTCFIECRAFGKTAETINKYLVKGRSVFVEGRLDFDQWEKDGQKFSKHRVTVEKFQFLGTAAAGQSANAGQAAGQPDEPPKQQNNVDDDIPF